MTLVIVAVLAFIAGGAAVYFSLTHEVNKPRCPELSPFDRGQCFKSAGHKYPHEARATGNMALQGMPNHWWSSRETPT